MKIYKEFPCESKLQLKIEEERVRRELIFLYFLKVK